MTHAAAPSSLALRQPSTTTPLSTRVAMGGMLAVCLLGALLAGKPSQGVHGALFSLAGLLMMLCPPKVRLPWPYPAAVLLIVAAGAAAFLPSRWFAMPEWRAELVALGLDLGDCLTPTPLMTLQSLAGMALALAGALFLLGHRLADREFPWFALGFAAAVATYAGTAIFSAHQPPSSDTNAPHVFGFFPNRNHTATWLVMGLLVGAGLFWQGLRLARGALASGAVVCMLLVLWALLGYNISRAGMVLLGGGVLIWWMGLGRTYFSKWVLLAIALAATGLGWVWMRSDSVLKARVEQTAGLLKQTLTPPEAEEIPLAPSGAAAERLARPPSTDEAGFDLREFIYRDTWDMVRSEPWAGVGVGNFQYVFPHYRRYSSSYSRAVHPESDWWWWLAEMGPLAPVLAAGGVIALALTVRRRGRGQRLWMGRMACLAAALVVPLHGVFDVPGHVLTLFWAAVWLAAIAWRPAPEEAAAGAFTRWGFRLAGAGTLVAGLWLLRAQWSDRPIALVQGHFHTQRALELYRREMAAASTAPAPAVSDQAPTNGVEGDPLYLAYQEMNRAVAREPLEPYIHYVRAALALCFEGLEEEAARSLAIQRALEPWRPETPLAQADLLASGFPDQVPLLWEDALRRGAHLSPYRPTEAAASVRRVPSHVLSQMRRQDALAAAALTFLMKQPSAQQPALIEAWCRSAPPRALDNALPGLLTTETLPLSSRQQWWKIWAARGSKGATQAFATQHPEFARP